MARYNIGLSQDINWAMLDFLSPGVSVEHRIVTGSASPTIFQHSCSVGDIYYLQSDGAPVYYTLNGATPDITAGTGSNKGIPVANGAREYFIPTSGLNVVKAVISGTTAAHLVLGRKSQSGSVVVP